MTATMSSPYLAMRRITDQEVWAVRSSAIADEGALLTGISRSQPWFEKTAKALDDLLTLEPGWDSYGALEIDPIYVEAIRDLLWHVMRDSTLPPSVVPTNRGAVQVEWHARGIDLEIEALSRYRFYVSFEDSASGREWEGEVTTDLTIVDDFIERLS